MRHREAGQRAQDHTAWTWQIQESLRLATHQRSVGRNTLPSQVGMATCLRTVDTTEKGPQRQQCTKKAPGHVGISSPREGGQTRRLQGRETPLRGGGGGVFLCGWACIGSHHRPNDLIRTWLSQVWGSQNKGSS